jgi:hypothetical protein
MYFTQTRVVHQDLNSSDKQTNTDFQNSKSFLVSDSLNLYNTQDADISKINQFVSKIQEMHNKDDFKLPLLPIMSGQNLQNCQLKSQRDSINLTNSASICEVSVFPEKDIICSQKNKALDVSVTFFIKGSFKIYIDVYSFPINTFLLGPIYKNFCEEFFTEKLIHKFMGFYTEQKKGQNGEVKHLLNEAVNKTSSNESLPSNYSFQLSLKSHMRTYTNNSVYRKETTKAKSGNGERKVEQSGRTRLVSQFLEVLFGKVNKKLVLQFLKKNVSKKDICNFLAKNIQDIDMKSIQKSSIVAEANDISQASIEIKEVSKDFLLNHINSKLEENKISLIKSKINPKPQKNSKSLSKSNNFQNMSNTYQLNDLLNSAELKATKRLEFISERMNFSKKQFLLINNGESKIEFELSLLQSVFQESNLRDETQIDRFDTEIEMSRKQSGKSNQSCRCRGTR